MYVFIFFYYITTNFMNIKIKNKKKFLILFKKNINFFKKSVILFNLVNNKLDF